MAWFKRFDMKILHKSVVLIFIFTFNVFFIPLWHVNLKWKLLVAEFICEIVAEFFSLLFSVQYYFC